MNSVKQITNPFIEAITGEQRDQDFLALCNGLSPDALRSAGAELEVFRRSAENLYERVRASLFLYSLHRFVFSESGAFPQTGHVPFEAHAAILDRRFEEAIQRLDAFESSSGPNDALSSAFAEAYHGLAFQTLTDQVRSSVRASLGNRWMFRVGHSDDHPVRVHPALLVRAPGQSFYPILCEHTPVRLDLSHSGWSDIFFLGMDYPEGARVLNISVDLGVYGRDATPRSPIESRVRVIDEPLLRITSIDLNATKDIEDFDELFNFGNDYLGLLKAGVIASGLLPPSFEGSSEPLSRVLERIVGPGMGIELVTQVNDIPKGSRLAVSTNLLGSIVAVLMRATRQTDSLDGGLTEPERRLAASRAILGEWLGGSGGGWQDSGGLWPGVKIIEGAPATDRDPEWGVSKGCLLPRHRLLGESDLHPELAEKLTESMVLVHGGMAQDVGPILEMVTEKYLLRSAAEWDARLSMRSIFDRIQQALSDGDIHALGNATMDNWSGPLKTIIPWVSNAFTERIIEASRATLGNDFYGFLMLGGMSGGGMALLTAPERHAAFRDEALQIMGDAKRDLEDALPFAMDPVVYDFAISKTGTHAELLTGADALMPHRYYPLQIPGMTENADRSRIAELNAFSETAQNADAQRALVHGLSGALFNSGLQQSATTNRWDAESNQVKTDYGFDTVQHELLRDQLQSGRIGLARNRLPADTAIEDVGDDDLQGSDEMEAQRDLGVDALRDGRVAILTLAGGMGSRWTTGAGVVKAVNPFAVLSGRHRSFLEIHAAKSRKTMAEFGAPIPHIVSTSFLTDTPIRHHLERDGYYGYADHLYLSPGRSIGQRFIPMARDLQFLWEEMPQEMLDERKQRVRESVRGALLNWARAQGEGSDYTDNVALQRFTPPGHWYEFANLLLNGVLADVLAKQPNVQTLLLHNVDTLGASADPGAVGAHLASGNTLNFEVIPRFGTDRGGGLARVNGQLRIVEGLAQPCEEDEFKLRYYSSMSTWIEIDPLLNAFGLERAQLTEDTDAVAAAVRNLAQRMPTYVTIKDVKRRWGHGHEDVYPVAQCEKLWSDMTALPGLACGYLAVPRKRGQQLKDPSELDPWANDGSRTHVESLCSFD
jgi:hypothetical protein